MGSKFKLSDILSDESRAQRAKMLAVERLDINSISLDANNFYNTDNIASLKSSIELFGLQQNLVVQRSAVDSLYIIVSGHRRYRCLYDLYQETGDRDKYGHVPCYVLPADLTDAEKRILLIETNSTTRVLTNAEKMRQAQELKELYTQYKADGGELPGRVRDYVAAELGMSHSGVARLEHINNNLSAKIMPVFNSGDMSVNVASKLAKLPGDKQLDAWRAVSGKPQKSVDAVAAELLEDVWQNFEKDKPAPQTLCVVAILNDWGNYCYKIVKSYQNEGDISQYYALGKCVLWQTLERPRL